MIHPLLEPEQILPRAGSRWMTVIFNNETTAFKTVVEQLMKVTKCDIEEAKIEAWEAHTFGQAPVFFGSKESCEEVDKGMGEIGVKCEVRPEWD